MRGTRTLCCLVVFCFQTTFLTAQETQPENVPAQSQPLGSEVPQVLRTYQVSDLLEQLKKEASLTQSQSEAFLIRRIENLKLSTKEGEPQFSPVIRAQVENSFVVQTTQAGHEAVVLCLETLRTYGIRQIVLRTKVLRGPVETISKLPVAWQYVKSNSSSESKPTSQGNGFVADQGVRTAEFMQTPPGQWSDVHVVPGTHVATRSRPELTDARLPINRNRAPGELSAEATSVVERAAPVLYAILDPKQQRELNAQMETMQDQGVETLFAPSVVVFNGQLATVEDIRERPLVTGIHKVLVPMLGSEQKQVEFAPETTVYKEGTTLLMRPELLSDNQLDLSFYLRIENIRSVEQLDLPRFDGRGPMKIQIPEVAKTTFRSQIPLPLDHTLVVRAVERDESGKAHNVLVLCRCSAIETARSAQAKQTETSTP